MLQPHHREELLSLAIALTILTFGTSAPAAPDSAVRMIVIRGEEHIAVTEWGTGDPLIIVPGLLGSSFGFRKIVPQLVESGHRVIVIDVLGTGRSSDPERADYSLTAQAQRVAQVVDTLGISRALFVCHAIGGSICYRLALSRADLVAGIVSVNGGAGEGMATPGLKLALKFASVLKIFLGEGWARNKMRGELKSNSADPSWVTDEVVAGYTANYRGLGPLIGTLKRMAAAKESEPLHPRLGEIRMPVTLVLGTGARKPAVPQEQVAALGVMPSFTVDTVANAGVYIHEEQPAALLTAIQSARRSLSGSDSPR